MNPDKITQNAARERAREQKTKKKRWSWPSKKGFTVRTPESWYVYTRIYPGGSNRFIWLFLAFTGGSVCLMIYWLNHSQPEWLLYIGASLIFLFLLRITIYWLIKIAGYPSYKKWQTTLLFPVQGWQELGNSKNFPRNQYWKLSTVITVHLKPDTTKETRQLVADCLYLFCKKANSWFYPANQVQIGFLGDPRSKWQLVSPESAAGSACPGVAGSVYLLIHKELRSIHAQHNVITSVQIEWGNDLRHVDPEDTGYAT